MKKFIVFLIIMCLAIPVFAQQVQQQTSGRKKMKKDWEKEYYSMEKKYNSTYNAYKVLMDEVEHLRKENKEMKAKQMKFGKMESENNSLRNQKSKLQTENNALKSENSKLRAENTAMKTELDKYKKGGQKKELKRIK